MLSPFWRNLSDSLPKSLDAVIKVIYLFVYLFYFIDLLAFQSSIFIVSVISILIGVK